MTNTQRNDFDALNNLYAAATLAPLPAVQHDRIKQDAQQLAETLKALADSREAKTSPKLAEVVDIKS